MPILRFSLILVLISCAWVSGAELFENVQLSGSGNQVNSGATITGVAGSIWDLDAATVSLPSDVTRLGSSIDFASELSGKPTTIAGYGITDSILYSTSSYSNPAWITALAWSKISGTPTTITGYGITDPILYSSGSYSNPAWITALAWSKITGTPTTISGYGITDPILYSSGSYSNPSWLTALAWSKIFGTPTTFVGYGIDNVFSETLNGLVPAHEGYAAPAVVPQGSVALGPTGWTVVASQTQFSNHYNDTDNPHDVTAAQLGLEDATILGNPDPPSPLAPVLLHWSGSKLEFGVGTAEFPWGNLSGTPTTLTGYGIDDAQPLDADLTNIAALTTDSYGLEFLIQASEADARNYIGLNQVENVALSTWSGTSNINSVGTLTSGTWNGDTIAVANGGTGAINAPDARDNLGAAASGANTDITSIAPDSVTIGPTSWSYNPTGSGQLEITFPGGVASMYETGSPAAPYFYFPGTIYCDLLETSGIDAGNIVGVIPPSVIDNSIGGILYNWTDTGSQSSGIPWANTGAVGALEPTPGATTYFPNTYVNDGGSDSNTLEARYRTRAQFNADLMPTATAAIDWPEIAAGGLNTQTMTVTGAVTTNTPAVTIGWSAALSAGLILSQAWVSGANTVSVTLSNITGSPINPASITVRAAVQQF